MSIRDTETGLPMFAMTSSDVIEGMQYDTGKSERVGHKLQNSDGLKANKFMILYRTPGGRYFTYNHIKGETTSVNPLAANVTLKPIKKLEAETLYPELSDPQLSFNEAFKRIIEA